MTPPFCGSSAKLLRLPPPMRSCITLLVDALLHHAAMCLRRHLGAFFAVRLSRLRGVELLSEAGAPAHASLHLVLPPATARLYLSRVQRSLTTPANRVDIIDDIAPVLPLASRSTSGGCRDGHFSSRRSMAVERAAAAPVPWELEHHFGPNAVATIGTCAAAADAAGCRVQLSPAEQRERSWSSRDERAEGEQQAEPHAQPERPRSAAFCSALRQFLHTGACWLESGALPAETVSACKACAVSHLATLRSELARQKRELLHSRSGGDPGDHRTTALLRCDFAELTERDGGRVDMRYRMDEPPFSDPSIVRRQPPPALIVMRIHRQSA